MSDAKSDRKLSKKLKYVDYCPMTDSPLTSYQALDGKWGFIDMNSGKIVIPATYEKVWDFTEGLAAVAEGYNKVGFIDMTGKLVIPMLDVDHRSGYYYAHNLLVELEKWHDVTVITQNVDNLHERAGSSNVIHLHRELTKVTSSVHRNDPACVRELPLDVPIRMGDKAADGSQLRPYVVWFGEFVNNYEMAARIVRSADVFVVIGTSLTVTPAADLIKCPRYGVPKFIIDPCEPFDPYDDNYPEGYVHIHEKATSGIETFIDRMMTL